jgi:hypothetical protein
MLKVLVCAILAVVGLLLLPMAIRIELSRGQQPLALRVDGAFCLGLFGLSLVWSRPSWTVRGVLLSKPLAWPSLRGGRTESRTRPQKKPPGRAKPAGATGPGRSPTELLRWVGGPVVQLLGSLPRTLSMRHLHVSGEVGMPDPADTGMIYGGIAALRGLSLPWLHVDLEPCFVRSGVRGSAEIRLHLYLGRLLWSFLRAGCLIVFRWLPARRRMRPARR